MKRKLMTIVLAAAMSVAATAAMAADKLALQLKWVTQAQFAGYYVAKDKGFYKEENLDVEIKPGGPDIAPVQVLAGGGADVVLDWMPSALASREKGVAAGQYCPAVQDLRHDADLPQGFRDQLTGRLQGQDAWCVVLRQRISVPVVDEPAWHCNRRQR